MQGNKPSKKKISFGIQSRFKGYLKIYNSFVKLPLHYSDLQRYIANTPLLHTDGTDTLWETVYYSDFEYEEYNRSLCEIYALLKTDGNLEAIEHLEVARIDYCTFGNTNPFRIRIINKLNDNYDHFYIKRVDSSRIYGLELERLLSPNYVGYLVDKDTLVEEHIAGIPGDDFMKRYISNNEFDNTRIAKEFIKFNERCFVRLLGDMRSYNYIVDITPDIEGSQYRIRAIDFDQQSYEGWKSFYLPQYFKGNNPIIKMGMKHISPAAVAQYQLEERSLIALRAKSSKARLNSLLKCMINDSISFPKKVEQLREELSHHHRNNKFLTCKNMGEIVLTNIELVLQKEFKQSIIDISD